MDRLIEFLKSQLHLLLFIVLEVIALVLLFGSDRYKRSVVLSTTNRLSGSITEWAHEANTYRGLREENIQLMERNAYLEKELQAITHKYMRLSADTLSWKKLTDSPSDQRFPYTYMVAKVVGNSLFSKNIYLTIDLGKSNGIGTNMGVVSTEGVVGVVETVGNHYAKVLPIVNGNFKLNCRINRSESVGTLEWDGIDIEHARLLNLPKHIHFEKGDSVVTSGYSSIFPENIFVGWVVEELPAPDDHFLSLRIKLATDFNRIKQVYVLKNFDQEERTALESK